MLKVELVPWPVAVAWHGLATLLLAIGAIGIHRSSLGSSVQASLGWLGIALVVGGQLFSLEVTMLGCVCFGVAALMATRLPRWGGALLAAGAAGFLVTRALNGPFWSDPNPSPSLLPALAFGVSLLLIALGWLVLGLQRPVPRVRTEVPAAI
jgi:hypothetical protein